MSGHSKWAKIKHQKGLNDQKKGAIFTKLARNITLAAKEGGPDSDSNFSLRLAISKAKSVNMPLSNIERAVKKATGEGEKITIQRVSYEVVGPGGVNLIVDCKTDNTNRTLSDVKTTVDKFGGKLSGAGSLAWQFAEVGYIALRPAKLKKSEKFGGEDVYEPVDAEAAELELLEIPGIEDLDMQPVQDEDGSEYQLIELYTNKNDFSRAVKKIEELQYQVETAEIAKKPNDYVEVPDDAKNKVAALIDNLENLDDVDSVWSNYKE